MALKWMIILSYSIIFIGVITLNFNPKMLAVFLTLPIAVKLLKSIKEYVEVKDVSFKPRWYWGMFENWEEIQNTYPPLQPGLLEFRGKEEKLWLL